MSAFAPSGLAALRPMSMKPACEIEEYARAHASLEMEVTQLRNTADAAEAQAAELEAELQAVRWEKDDVEQRLQAAQELMIPRAARRLFQRNDDAPEFCHAGPPA